MGDIGSALSDSLSGLGSNLGNIFSGAGNALAGTGGASGVSNLINALTGGGTTTASASPAVAAQTSQAISSAIDPTGSVAASNAINPPNAATVAQRTGDVGGTQSSGAPQPAPDTVSQTTDEPSSGGDAIRKLIAALRGQSVDPYQAGATPGPGMSQGTGGVGSQGRGSDAPYGEGASSQGEYGRAPLNIGPGKGQPFLPQWQGGEGEPAVDIPAIPGISAPTQAQRAQQAGEGAVEAATAPEAAPVDLRTIDPGGVPSWVSKAAGLTSPVGIAATVGPPAVAAAQEGVQKAIEQGEPVSSAWFGDTGGYTPQAAPAVTQPARPYTQTPPPPTALPHDNVGKTPTKDEYEKWLKDQGEPPATAKKKADKSTPAERKKAVPDADKPPDYWVDDQGRKHEIPPTKKPGERPYHMDEIPAGQSGMMRDVHGMQGVPQMLGQLAQLALPLILSGAFSGGGGGGGWRGPPGRFGGPGGRGFPFGQGGHGRFGGGPFHPGEHPGGFGSGMWPYHHPGMGWQGFGYHPGGGWQPWGGPGAALARRHDAEMNAGGGDPSLQMIQALLGGGQQGRQGQEGRPVGSQPTSLEVRQPRAGGQPQYKNMPIYQGAGTPSQQGPQGQDTADNVLATIRQRESGGKNLPPEANYDYPNSHASGLYQFQPDTWRAVAQESGDTEAQKYQEAYLAPPEVQDRVAAYALKKYGPNATYTWAASGPYPSVQPGSVASTGGGAKEGTTPTGDTNQPLEARGGQLAMMGEGKLLPGETQYQPENPQIDDIRRLFQNRIHQNAVTPQDVTPVGPFGRDLMLDRPGSVSV